MIKATSFALTFLFVMGLAMTQERILCKHQLGESIVPQYPARIVVMDVGALDQLTRLGVQGIVAVPNVLPDHLSQYNADEFIKIRDPWDPDLEAVKRAQPDFIIYGARDPKIYALLSEMAPTISYEENYMDYMETYVPYLKSLGQVFGKEKEVERHLVGAYEEIHVIRRLSEQDNKRGLILLYTQGRYHAFGPGSRFGFIHDELGVKPLSDTLSTSIRGSRIDDHFIEQTNPDYLFIVDRDAALGWQSAGKEIIINDAIKKTNAYKNNKIVWLTPRQWYLSGHGMYILETKIREIREGLYPLLK